MKATSIEQIREHLARGGRVMCHWNNQNASFGKAADSVWSAGLNDIIVDSWSRMTLKFDSIYVDHWELLPIEEKPLPGIDVKTLPIFTEDPTDAGQTLLWRDVSSKEPLKFRSTSNGQVRILIGGNDTGAGERIRKALLFGHYPAMNDLIAWWQATTGERIEWGRRCEKCGGEGVTSSEYMALTNPPRVVTMKCPACKDHPGYTVRPTWMEAV